MDNFIVGIIVAGAVMFTIKRFLKIYKSVGSKGCGECSCSSKENCKSDFPVSPKR
jgi:hypothetical protein